MAQIQSKNFKIILIKRYDGWRLSLNEHVINAPINDEINEYDANYE